MISSFIARSGLTPGRTGAAENAAAVAAQIRAALCILLFVVCSVNTVHLAGSQAYTVSRALPLSSCGASDGSYEQALAEILLRPRSRMAKPRSQIVARVLRTPPHSFKETSSGAKGELACDGFLSKLRSAKSISI